MGDISEAGVELKKARHSESNLGNSAFFAEENTLERKRPLQGSATSDIGGGEGHLDLKDVRIRHLEAQIHALQTSLEARNTSLDRKVHAEFGRIRDAWKEKLDAQKQINAELKQDLHEARKTNQLLEDEVQLIPEYRRRVAALEDVLNNQRIRLESLEQSDSGRSLGAVRPDVLALAAEKAHLQTQVETLMAELERWRQAARTYAEGSEENWTAVDPTTLQMKLTEDLEKLQQVDLDRNKDRMDLNDLRKANKELTLQLKTLEREKTHLASEVEELTKNMELADQKERSLTSQIAVLRKCIQHRVLGQHEESNKTLASPISEPPPVSLDIDREPQLVLMKQQLQHHKETEERLRSELTQAEAKLSSLADKEAQVEELSAKLEKSFQVRHQLVTQIQKLTIDMATRPPTNDSSNGSHEQLLSCLKKERDSAIKRAEMAKREVRYQQELWTIMIQKVLGWKITIDETRSRTRIVMEAQSAFTPQEDPGFVRVSAESTDIIRLLSSNETKAFAQKLLPEDCMDDLSETKGDEDCTTPIASQPGALEPRLALSFTGRYRERWRKDQRWRQQLEMRRPFATFLAFMTLDEHHARQRRAGWKQPPNDSPAARLMHP